MSRRFISTQEAREKFADTLRRANEGEHHVINHRSKTGYAVLVDPGWYARAAEALGEPIPDWAATDD